MLLPAKEDEEEADASRRQPARAPARRDPGRQPAERRRGGTRDDRAGPAAGAGGSAGIGGFKIDQADFKYPIYIDRMVAIMSMNWFKPAQVVQTNPVVHFQIQKDGTITDVALVTSSGLPFVDRAAMRAVYASSPLPPLPADYAGRASGHPGRVRVRRRVERRCGGLRSAFWALSWCWPRFRRAAAQTPAPDAGARRRHPDHDPGRRRAPPLDRRARPLRARYRRPPGPGRRALHGDPALRPRVRRGFRGRGARALPDRGSATPRPPRRPTAGWAPAPRPWSTRGARSPATRSRSRPGSGT